MRPWTTAPVTRCWLAEILEQALFCTIRGDVEQCAHLARQCGVTHGCRIGNEGPVAAAPVPVDVTLCDRRERQAGLRSTEQRDRPNLRRRYSTAQHEYMPRIAGAWRPFTNAGVSKTGAIESAVLPARPLQRVVQAGVEVELRSELEHIRSKPEVELPAVTTQVTNPAVHAPEVVRHPRFGCGYGAGCRIDPGGRDEDRPVRLARQREALHTREVRIHGSRLRQIVREETTDPYQQMILRAGRKIE